MIKHELDLGTTFIGSHLVVVKAAADDASSTADIDVRVCPPLIHHAPRCGRLVLHFPEYHPTIDTKPVPNTPEPEKYDVGRGHDFAIRNETFADQCLANRPRQFWGLTDHLSWNERRNCSCSSVGHPVCRRRGGWRKPRRYSWDARLSDDAGRARQPQGPRFARRRGRFQPLTPPPSPSGGL
jgi:hypothetical protein